MANERKKVSIVLPVYNGANHIANSINSIINQTYRNWELIIVNDCSTDKTLQICNEFTHNDNRIKLFSNEKNLKLPNSLNIGFEVATGDYYTWTSDDNMYKPNAIETLVHAMEQYPDAVMVYADYTSIDADGEILYEVKLQEPQYIVTGNVFGACFLYKAEIAKRVGKYDANLFLAEDYDYWMRIYRFGRIIHITDNLYLYRHHECSLSETKKDLIQEQTYKALEKNFLPLYVDAKKNQLDYSFFDQMLERGHEHLEETKALLIEFDSGYRRYLKRITFKETIYNTIWFKLLRRMKSFL